MSLARKTLLTRLQAPVIGGAQDLAVLEIPNPFIVTENKDKVLVVQEESDLEVEELEEGEIKEEATVPVFKDLRIDFEQE